MVGSEELKAKQARDRISKFINRFQTETAKAIPPKLKVERMLSSSRP